MNQSNDSLKRYLTSVKGSQAYMSSYSVSLQKSVTGYRQVSKAIKLYKNVSDPEEQRALASTISTTNQNLGNYLNTLNGTTPSMKNYIASLLMATGKTIGLQVATMALNAALSMGISFIISGVISAISYFFNRTDEIIAAGEEAADRIKSIREELRSQQKTVAESGQRYAELAQGVDQLTGKKLTLDHGEYQEFLDLSNELAETFPTLDRIYDRNGNAILQLGGSVDTIIESLDELLRKESELSNLKMANDMPKLFDGLVVETESINKEFNNVKQYKDDYQDLLSEIETEDFLPDLIDTIFNGGDLEITAQSSSLLSKIALQWTDFLKDNNIDFSTLAPTDNKYDLESGKLLQLIHISASDVDNEELKEKIAQKVNELIAVYRYNLDRYSQQVYLLTEQKKDKMNSFVSSLSAWLDTDNAVIQNMLDSIDWSSFESYEDIEKFIEDKLVAYFATDEGKDLSNQVLPYLDINTSFKDGELSFEEYQTKINEFLKTIANAPEELQVPLKAMLNLETKEDGTVATEYDSMLENVQEKLQDAFDQNAVTLSFEDLKIATEEIEESNLTFGEMLAKIKEIKETKLAELSLLSIPELESKSEDFKQETDSIISSLDTLNNAFEEQNEEGSLSAGTIQSIIDAGYSAALQFDAETNACILNKEALQELIDKKIENQIRDLELLQTDIASRLLKDGVIAYDTAEAFYELARSKDATQQSVGALWINADAQIKSLEKIKKNRDSLLNGSTSAKSSPKSSSNSSSDPLKDAFTEEYNTLKHNLEMEYITQKEYYENLEALNQKYFAGKAKYLSDYRKYEEEIYKGLQKIYKETLEAQISLSDKQLEAGAISYAHYSSTVKSLLDDMYSQNKITSADYFTYIQKMLEKQKSIYDKVLSAVNRRYDTEISKWEDAIESIEQQNEALEEQQEKYDKVLSAIQDLITSKQEEIQTSVDALEQENTALDKQIDEYNSVLNVVEKVYNKKQDELTAQQDAIQERIDALREENDEQKKSMELQKARYELERSRNQRSQLVFDGSQFIYTTDDNAIKENQEQLNGLELEATISSMEKEKEILQDLIEELDHYKNLWNEISNAYQDKEDQKITEEILGKDYEDFILQNRLEDINSFKNHYLMLQDRIEDNTSLIESYQQKIEYYDSLAQKWEQLSSSREQSINRELAAQLLGQEWETLILEDRLLTFQQFQEQYLAIQTQLEDNAGLIASYHEKITYYEALKQQWADISSSYENAVNDQYAAMILGQNWEAEILSGRLETLNTFKNNYVQLQQAMADAAIESSNAQVKAYENAKNHAITANASISNNTGSSHEEETTYSVVDSKTGKVYISSLESEDKAKNWIATQEEKRRYSTSMLNRMKVQKYANGGIVSKKDQNPIFDSIARLLGEDHMIAVQEGEIILPKEFSNPNTVTPLLSTQPWKHILSNYPGYSSSDHSQSIQVNMGDIHLHEVQDADGFAHELMLHIHGAVTREVFRTN